jgi:hypothetical protein
MTETKKRAEIVSSFTDRGTGKSYKAGTKPLIDAGSFGNYLAAGLVRAVAVAEAKPKPASKRNAARRAPRASVSAEATDSTAAHADRASD